MKLDKKRLAAEALGVGKSRIVFNTQRLAEINEAITKQDIRDLLKDGALFVRAPAGRRTNVVRKQRRRTGSIKKKVGNKKESYMRFIRSARRYIAHSRALGEITREHALVLRKESKARQIITKTALRERIKEIKGQ